jgi:hypothetical protein
MKKTVIVLEFSKCIEDEETIPVVPNFFMSNSDSSADIVVHETKSHGNTYQSGMRI